MRGIGWAAIAACLVAIASTATWPFVDPTFDYFKLDDGRSHGLRLYLFDHLLSRGVLYPRWVPDLALGYGYPLFNYYSPGTYYVAELFHTLGVPIYNALQWAGATAAGVAAAGAVVLARVVFGNTAT